MKYEDFKNKVFSLSNDDYSKLLNLGRKIKEINDIDTDIRIAVLGSVSTQLIASVLKVQLCKYDLFAEIYESEYNSIFSDVFDDNSKLYKFNPSIIIVITDYRDIIGDCPNNLCSFKEVNKLLDETTSLYAKFFDKIHNKLPNSQIFFTNFVKPPMSLLGNLECNYIFSVSSYFKLLNIDLIKKKPTYVTLVDTETLAFNVGLND